MNEKTLIYKKLIKNGGEILENYKNTRGLVSNLRAKYFTNDNVRQQVSITMGDYAQTMLEIFHGSPYAKVLVENENEKLYSDDLSVAVFKHNTVRDTPDKIIEKDFFNVEEDGLCLRAAGLFNLFAHRLKNEEFVVGKACSKHFKDEEIDIDRCNITEKDLKTINNFNGKIAKAFEKKAKEKYFFQFGNVTKALRGSKYDIEQEDVKRVHALMKSEHLGSKEITKEETKVFVDALMIESLKQKMYKSKEMAVKSMIYLMADKEMCMQKAVEENPDISAEKVAQYMPEIMLVMSKENKIKAGSEMSINGKSLYRLCGATKNDVNTTQLHLSQECINETMKEFDYQIPECNNIEALVPNSAAIVNEIESPEQKTKFIKELYKDHEKYSERGKIEVENIRVGSFNKLKEIILSIGKTKKAFEKVVAINNQNRENVGEDGMVR